MPLRVITEESLPVLAERLRPGQRAVGQEVFHPLAVLEWLRSNGLVSKQDADSLRQIVSTQQGNVAYFDPADHGSVLLTDVETLAAFARAGCLKALVGNLRIFIRRSEHEQLIRGIKNARLGEELHRQARQLIEAIRDDARIQQCPVQRTAVAGGQSTVDEERPHFALAAAHLALEKEMPLLADDRCLQEAVLNERERVVDAAFGTDLLIKTPPSELSDTGHLQVI